MHFQYFILKLDLDLTFLKLQKLGLNKHEMWKMTKFSIKVEISWTKLLLDRQKILTE